MMVYQRSCAYRMVRGFVDLQGLNATSSDERLGQLQLLSLAARLCLLLRTGLCAGAFLVGWHNRAYRLVLAEYVGAYAHSTAGLQRDAAVCAGVAGSAPARGDGGGQRPASCAAAFSRPAAAASTASLPRRRAPPLLPGLPPPLLKHAI
eukprot:tig00000142_g8645.t1